MTTTLPANLTPSRIKNPEALATALEHVLENAPSVDAASRLVAERQRTLRTLVGDEAWSAYLQLETAVNAREGEALHLTAKWAFDQGRGDRA